MKYTVNTTIIFLGAFLILSHSQSARSAMEQAGQLPEIQLMQQNTPDTDLISGRAVIERQLKAFRMRDASGAFGYVSRSLQRKYQSPVRFLRSVRYTYRPLYEHLSYRFTGSQRYENSLLQKVELIGPDGMPVTALYRLIQNAEEGVWTIDSYTILEPDAQPV